MVNIYRQQTSFLDYLIVGQGLAGSLLAWQLLQRGKRLKIVDSGLNASASRTAAGLINPVTGKRLVRSLKIEHYLSAAKRLYRKIEDYFGQPFYFEKPQIRLFKDPNERQIYERRSNDPEYAAFLGRQFKKNTLGNALADDLGGFYQKQCGYLDTMLLLNRLQDYFLHENIYIENTLDLAAIEKKTTSFRWENNNFKNIIFCEGFQAINNPWFSWLPFQPVKGEILTLETDTELPMEIILKGNWLLPLSPALLKTGANYQWDVLDNNPTPEVAKKLLNAFQSLYSRPPSVEIIAHRAGVRPATQDKQPFIGSHPRRQGLHIFNGFGSKGSLMIPECATQFVDYLLEGKPVAAENSIERCLKFLP